MTILLLQHPISHLAPTDWAPALAKLNGVPQGLAAGTILFELGAPLALLGPRWRAVIMPGLFLVQLGIYLLLGLRFFTLMSAFCFWIPWSVWPPRRWVRKTALTSAT